MPIYEYQCEICDHKLETIQKLSDAPLTECPECGESTLRKLVSAASFRLKGSGWYETDFKDKPKKKETDKEKDGKPAKSSEPATSGSSDTNKSSSSSSDTKAASGSA